MQEDRFVIHTLPVFTARERWGSTPKEKAARPLYELEREGARRRGR